MKKKILKVLALVACAVLLVVGSIAGTLAYLKDTAKVTNTFTVGNVSITMDEANVNLYGEPSGTRNAEGTGNEYKLIPGHNYVKDPTITVLANSEACYVFVKVENGIAAIEGGTTIADQMTANGWTELDGVANVYYYNGAKATNGIVATADANQALVVFEEFTLKTDADVASYVGNDGKVSATIVVTAYAVQADGFNADINAAWTAASAAQAQG